MRHLSSVNKYFLKYKWRFALGIAFVLLSNIFSVLIPKVIGFAVDTVMSKNYTSYTILMATSAILGFALLRGIFLFLMRQTLIVMSRLIEYDQKNELYNHYQQLEISFYKRNNTGDLMSRITEDISRVRMYTGPGIMYILNTGILFIMVSYQMFRVNVELAFYTLLPLPLLGVAIYLINNVIENRSELIQQQLAALNTTAQESFSGIRVIKSFVQEKFMLLFFDKECDEYRQRQLNLARVESIFFPTIFLLVGLSTILTIYIGGNKVISGQIKAGEITEFVLYINNLTWPIAMVGWVVALIQRGAASQKRINEFLAAKPEIESTTHKSLVLNGEVEFRNVSFTYDNTGIEALKNISFKLKKGQKLAVIGRTGSGKTTLAQLLVRLYDCSKGQILIDGQNINDINLSSLRRQVGYVPQEVFLFSDTVSNNIQFGSEGKRKDEIANAARYASVARDIEHLSEQYNTVVGERGVTLSGGQKQRISMARALIKNPNIVLLDDCLSAVDAHTEQDILKHMEISLMGKTSIIITHRIFNLLSFDKIIMLEDGAIIEEGTHHELINRKGAYFNLYELQQMEEKNYSV